MGLNVHLSSIEDKKKMTVVMSNVFVKKKYMACVVERKYKLAAHVFNTYNKLKVYSKSQLFLEINGFVTACRFR